MCTSAFPSGVNLLPEKNVQKRKQPTHIVCSACSKVLTNGRVLETNSKALLS